MRKEETHHHDPHGQTLTGRTLLHSPFKTHKKPLLQATNSSIAYKSGPAYAQPSIQLLVIYLAKHPTMLFVLLLPMVPKSQLLTAVEVHAWPP